MPYLMESSISEDSDGIGKIRIQKLVNHSDTRDLQKIPRPKQACTDKH